MSTNPAVPRVKRRVLLASTAGAAAAGGVALWATQNANAQDGATSQTDTPQAADGGAILQEGVVGWGSQNGGVTGGEGGEEITVTDFGALQEAAGMDGAAIIHVSGTIDGSGLIDITSDKTLIGESGAQLNGFGFDVSGQSNIIITRLTFDGWDDDAINIQESSTNIWVDHNTFGTGNDGSCDIKRESDYCTVSWNRFNGSDKNMLLGHDDGHTADIGHLRVTYHHNFFNGTNQRNPRVRFGEQVHVFNNYYLDIGSYGVATTMDAGVIFEANYIENTEEPVHIGEGDSDPGRLVAIDNHLVNSGEPLQEGDVNTSLPYSYSPDPADQVASIVSAGAGAG